jgi:hypothetical protein
MPRETPSIPEYYRHYVDQPSQQSTPSERKEAVDKSNKLPSGIYRGNTFTIGLNEEWTDKTIHIISGPVSDEIQHNIIINVDPEPGTDSLINFAEVHIKTLEEQLKGCRLLKKDKIQLNNGLPAYRTIFRWFPAENVRLYQEQIYVFQNGTGYILTASFTKKTRKTLGPQVERLLMTFSPHE